MNNQIVHRRRDPHRIDVDDPMQVRYMHHQFPWLSQKQIREVIKKHGPDRDVVESVLERAGSSSRRDG